MSFCSCLFLFSGSLFFYPQCDACREKVPVLEAQQCLPLEMLLAASDSSGAGSSSTIILQEVQGVARDLREHRDEARRAEQTAQEERRKNAEANERNFERARVGEEGGMSHRL